MDKAVYFTTNKENKRLAAEYLRYQEKIFWKQNHGQNSGIFLGQKCHWSLLCLPLSLEIEQKYMVPRKQKNSIITLPQRLFQTMEMLMSFSVPALKRLPMFHLLLLIFTKYYGNEARNFHESLTISPHYVQKISCCSCVTPIPKISWQLEFWSAI